MDLERGRLSLKIKSIFQEVLLEFRQSVLIPLHSRSIWIAMREGSRWGGGWAGTARAVPVVPFIYSRRSQCPITHAAAWEILLIETLLKPCVSSADRLRAGRAEGEEERAIDKTEVRQNTRPALSPIFPEYVCPWLLSKPPLASMNNEKEQWVC